MDNFEGHSSTIDSQRARTSFSTNEVSSPAKLNDTRAEYFVPSSDDKVPLIGDPYAPPEIPSFRAARTSTGMSQEYHVLQTSGESVRYYGTDEELSKHCHQKKPSRLAETRAAQRKLVIASVVCLCFLVAEFIGGYIAHSLAIMTDAAHLLSDFGGFMISLFALWLGSRPATKKLSFGWHRAEVMGALLSVLVIWVLTGILVYEAVQRIITKHYEVNATIMLIIAAVGVVTNIILGLTLHAGHSHGGHGHSHMPLLGSRDFSSSHASGDMQVKVKSNLNVRAAYIHVLGDLVQSFGVLFAALLIYFKPDYMIADPICTFIFSVLVLVTTLTILKDILIVLMEGTPKGLDFKAVMEDLQNVEGVKTVHNLHIWSLTMGTAALSVHLAVDSSRSTQSILSESSTLISRKYDIHHTTIQVEQYHDQMDNCSLCQEPQD